MGGIDKLDTICLLSKPTFQSKSLASLTVPKVIMDIRRIFQMFQTKATLFKVKCKICSKLTIKTPELIS